MEFDLSVIYGLKHCLIYKYGCTKWTHHIQILHTKSMRQLSTILKNPMPDINYTCPVRKTRTSPGAWVTWICSTDTTHASKQSASGALTTQHTDSHINRKVLFWGQKLSIFVLRLFENTDQKKFSYLVINLVQLNQQSCKHYAKNAQLSNELGKQYFN